MNKEAAENGNYEKLIDLRMLYLRLNMSRKEFQHSKLKTRKEIF